MKTKLWALALCLTILLSLCACGGSASAVPDSTDSEPTEAAALEVVEEVQPELEEAPDTEPTQTSAQEAEETLEEASAEEDREPEITVEYPLTTSGYTFTCWTTYGPGMEDYLSQIGTFPVFEKAEEITGVGIEFIPCDQSTQPEKLNLYVASGSMPDVMLSMASLYSTSGEGIVNDEVAYDLNEFMDLMPNYAKYISELDESTRNNLYTSSGYLPAIMTLGSAENVGVNIRQDWLDALGLEIPRTYDELENVLLAFKNNYGCRNAIYMLQDYGYTNYALANGYDTMVSAAMNGLHFYQKDGVICSGDFNEGAREYLQMLARWFQEGLFSDDCLTLKNVNDNADLIYKDDCGVWVSEAEFLTDRYKANAQDPNFNPQPMADVGKTEDQILHMYAATPRLEGQSAWSVTTSCTEPELVCQYCDWFFSEEGRLAANWGTEGLTYELDENGKPYYTDLILNTTEYPTPKLALTMYTGTPLPCGTSQEANDALLDPVIPAAGAVYRSNQDGAYTSNYTMTWDEMMEFFTISSDILTKKAEVVAQIVMGEADISAFDELEEYAYSCGLDRAIEISQAAYDRENK